MTTKQIFTCTNCNQVVGYKFEQTWRLCPPEEIHQLTCTKCFEDQIYQGEQQLALENQINQTIENIRKARL